MEKTLPIVEGWLTVAEAASLSGYSVHHLRHLLASGRVVGVKLEGRVWLVQRDSLLDYTGTMQALGRKKYDGWRGRRRA